MEQITKVRRPLNVADELRSKGKVAKSWWAKCVPVVLDNVALAVEQHSKLPLRPFQEECVRLPWWRMWCEWTSHGNSRSYGVMIERIAASEQFEPSTAEPKLINTSVDKIGTIRFHLDNGTQLIALNTEVTDKDTGSIRTETRLPNFQGERLRISPFLRLPHCPLGSSAPVEIILTDEGKCDALMLPADYNPMGHSYKMTGSPELPVAGDTYLAEWLCENWDGTHHKLNYFDSSYIPLLALSMLHARALEFAEVENVKRQNRLKRLMRGIGLTPTVRYKMLKVRDSVLADKNQISQMPYRLPLHLVRGNWAHYNESAPLFGKYVGKVWRPPHGRGDPRRGAIAKVYDV